MVSDQAPVEHLARAAGAAIEQQPVRGVELARNRTADLDRLPDFAIARQAARECSGIGCILMAMQLNGDESEHRRRFGYFLDACIAKDANRSRVKRSKPQCLAKCQRARTLRH